MAQRIHVCVAMTTLPQQTHTHHYTVADWAISWTIVMTDRAVPLLPPPIPQMRWSVCSCVCLRDEGHPSFLVYHLPYSSKFHWFRYFPPSPSPWSPRLTTKWGPTRSEGSVCTHTPPSRPTGPLAPLCLPALPYLPPVNHRRHRQSWSR